MTTTDRDVRANTFMVANFDFDPDDIRVFLTGERARILRMLRKIPGARKDGSVDRWLVPVKQRAAVERIFDEISPASDADYQEARQLAAVAESISAASEHFHVVVDQSERDGPYRWFVRLKGDDLKGDPPPYRFVERMLQIFERSGALQTSSRLEGTYHIDVTYALMPAGMSADALRAAVAEADREFKM